MKYVRTKDGEVRTTARLYKNEDGSYSNAYREVFGLPKIIVVKEADTIEGLCDRFVLSGIDIIFLNENHTRYRFEGGDEWFDVTETEFEKGIYGAIWTDKGLTYGARMNGKGDFKLL